MLALRCRAKYCLRQLATVEGTIKGSFTLLLGSLVLAHRAHACLGFQSLLIALIL